MDGELSVVVLGNGIAMPVEAFIRSIVPADAVFATIQSPSGENENCCVEYSLEAGVSVSGLAPFESTRVILPFEIKAIFWPLGV